MGFRTRAIVAGGVGFAVSVLAGCGSSGSLLSRNQAGQLYAELNQASSALSQGRCQDAEADLQNLQNSVASLGGVNQTLVRNLTQGTSTITQLATTECHPTAPPARTQTRTTTTQRTSTVTTPTTTTQTATTQTTTITPPPQTSTTGGGGLNTTTAPVTPPPITTSASTTTIPSPASTTPNNSTTPAAGTSTSGGAGLSGPGAGGGGNQQTGSGVGNQQ